MSYLNEPKIVFTQIISSDMNVFFRMYEPSTANISGMKGLINLISFK